MDGSDHENDGGSGHSFLHMILGCGLMLLVVLFLSAVNVTRGTGLVLVVLVLCPVIMVLMMRRKPEMSGSAGSRKRENHEDGI